MNSTHEPLDPREQQELERLEALAADGPIEEAQRARLDALRARLDQPQRAERLHRDVAAAYRALHHAVALEQSAAEDDEAFVRALQARLAAAPRAQNAATPTSTLEHASRTERAAVHHAPIAEHSSFARRRSTRVLVAAALLGAAGAGLWWWLDGGRTGRRDAIPEPAPSVADGTAPRAPTSIVIEPRVDQLGAGETVAPERVASAREKVRNALAEVPPAADRAEFLAALDARFATLHSEGWPVDVLVARRIERALNAPTLGVDEVREVEGALRWLALRHPESALPTLERAARDPRVQSAALQALAEAGTPRALERLAQRAQREPEDAPAAAQALARAGLSGVQILLELWRGEEATPEGVRVALHADMATLDRALAERVRGARSLERTLRELAERRGGPATRAALLLRAAERGFGPSELELAVALGGDALLEALLDHASREHGARRAASIDAVRRRLRFPAGADEARAVALRFAAEDDPRATILLEALAQLEPAAFAVVGLALLDVPALGGVYRDHVLLALAVLPPGVAAGLGAELERRVAAADFDVADHAAAWSVALAGQVDLDRALRFLAARTERARLDGTLRERLEKSIHAVLRAEPGLGALSALQRVRQLVQALL